MAAKFKIGDIVWAKLKSFPTWPAKVVQPKPEVKRPSSKKAQQFVYFYGSENYAWVPEEQLWPYLEFKTKFNVTSRVPRGFKEAVEATDDAVKALPQRKQPPLPQAPGKPKVERTPIANEKKNQVKKHTEQSKNKGAATKGRSMLKRGATPPSIGASSSKKSRMLVRSIESPSKGSIFNAGSTPGIDDAQDDKMLLADTAPRSIIATPMKIGFLGLGIMGSGMVNNLLKSGHEVTVWNRTATKCRDFVSQGALKGDCPAEVVASCDITFSCVSDPTALRDLVFGNAGVLQGIGPGRSYVDMSTVDIDTILDVSQAVNSRGGRFLEASVCGSREPAQKGELIILASGDEELFDDCYSCFEAMGKKSFYLGEVGSATKLTLVHNMLMGTMVAALAESIALADSVNVDLNVLQHIFDISPSLSSLIQSKTYAILGSDFDPNFAIQHQQKDLRLAIDMGDLYDQSFPVAAAANELFKKAKAKGYKENDIAAVYRAAAL